MKTRIIEPREPNTGEDQDGKKDNGMNQTIFNSLMNSSAADYGASSYNMKLFGVPHQFLKTVDYRVDNDMTMGRKFLQDIMAEAPIVTILPGKANYLPDYKESDKNSFKLLQAGLGSGDKNANSALEALINDNEEGRYFDFATDYTTYMNYVNLLCRTCAIFLGIGDEVVLGTNDKYRNYDWGDYKYWNNYTRGTKANHKSIFDFETVSEGLMGTHQYLNFYVDPSTSFNEASSNETSKSAIEGKFDQVEGIVKELSFFMETSALNNMKSFLEGSFASTMNGLSEMGGDEGFFKSIFGRTKQVVTGSNLIFPEIWGDAAYNKTYSVTMDLKTPYGDKESIYVNIIVPMMHALALALPKQTSANTYSAPFIVKMFSKGWFSCEMGIIESISIDKGPEQSWNIDGLPTNVKIQLQVKDLYSNLMMTPSNSPTLFFSNQGMIDFLGATCGVDLSKPNIDLKLQVGMALFLNRVTDIVPNSARKFVENVNSKLANLMR